MQTVINNQNQSAVDWSRNIAEFYGHMGVEAVDWLSNFEEVADLAAWSDAAKIIVFKRNLVGSARDWYDTDRPSAGGWAHCVS